MVGLSLPGAPGLRRRKGSLPCARPLEAESLPWAMGRPPTRTGPAGVDRARPRPKAPKAWARMDHRRSLQRGDGPLSEADAGPAGSLPQRAWAQRCSSFPRPDLWRWIQAQRRLSAVALMGPSRRRALDVAGFPWERGDPRWEESLVRFREFHRRHGHTHVPYCPADDPRLGPWVYLQRKAFRAGRLSEDRRRRLDEVGPGWSREDRRPGAGKDS